jgi:hypothetical protein
MKVEVRRMMDIIVGSVDDRERRERYDFKARCRKNVLNIEGTNKTTEGMRTAFLIVLRV